MADLPAEKNPPCTAHNHFMALSPHTWRNLPWDGRGDTEDIQALRITINRVLEAIGPVTEDTVKYRDFASIFFPETLDAEENPLETSVTEVEHRYNTQLAAQQLLLLLNTRKYAKKYGKKLPWYWYTNPSRYNYGGIEIGHVTTVAELHELYKIAEEGGDGFEMPSIELPN